MNGKLLCAPSRRDLVRGLAGAGLAVPFVAGATVAGRAAERLADYHDHPAVGIWIEESGGLPFAYNVTIGDGTLIYYNGYPNAFASQAQSNLPVFGFGVWRPTGPRSTEGVARIAWGDTSVRTRFTIWARSHLADDDDDTVLTEYREREVDAAGAVLSEYTGSTAARRMKWEPFEAPAPVATPAR